MHAMQSYRRDRLAPGRTCEPRHLPGKYAPAARKRTHAPNGRAASPSEAQVLASRIASLPDDEVRRRYHQLVDKRLDGDLTALERFEMERIEIRLDAADRDPQVEARDRQWDSERAELLESIEGLLLKLRK